MADPTKYTPGYSFANYQSVNPKDPLPGNRVDVELDDISNSLNETIDALGNVRRSDGALQNLIVTPESLSQSTIALIGDWVFKGAWAPATAYAVNDVVSVNGATYVCAVAHTSAADFDTDDAAGNWYLFANPPGALGQILYAAFDGDGNTTSFNVGVTLTDPKQIQVFVDGGVQDAGLMGVGGTQFTLPTPPPVGTRNVLVFGADLAGTTSASEAANSATAAANSASAAANSAAFAAGSEAGATTAQIGAETALDEFTDIYLGAKASDPTLDNDGNALQDGALYWNTVNTRLRVYNLGDLTWYDSATAVSDALLKTLNLADLTDVGAARVNLGLGALATQDLVTQADIDPSVELGGPSLGARSIIRYNLQSIQEDITLSEGSSSFTVDVGTDRISVGTDGGYVNGSRVSFETSGTLPGGLSASTVYYIVNATTTDAQVSLTYGGGIVDITTAGTGTHTVFRPVNGMSVGPITIETGFTVTVPEGSTWSIV